MHQQYSPDDLAALMQASAGCVLVHDAATGQIVWANEAACRVLEFDLRELGRRTRPQVGDRRAVDERLVGWAWLREAIENGSSRIGWQYRTRSGHRLPTDAVATRVELTDGPVVMVQFRVVQEDEQANDVLSVTASYVEALSRHTAAGLLVLASDATVLHVTDRALDQFGGLARTDMAGAALGRFCDISTTLDGARSEQGWAAAWVAASRAADPIGSVQLRLHAPEHTATWLGGTLERLGTRTGEVLLLTVHDISDRVADQRRRARARQQENYTARYNVMGDMAMAIAHELGQPLAAAGNFLAGVRTRATTMAVNGTLPVAAAAQFDFGLESAVRQIDRVSTIVTALRAFVGHLEQVGDTVDLNEVIDECSYFVRLRAGEHSVRVELDLSPEPVLVRCERVLTGQVVLNLCANAVDELAECAPEQRVLTVSTRRVGETGELVVEDRGRGFPRDPFGESFTAKEHGSGIGLALSHRIITRQHGSIWAEPRPAGGSRFGFRLPAADETGPG